METVPVGDPASVPPGTEVGLWRVVSRRGCGSYGVVYRVEKVGHADAGPFALKLARYPLDPRFEREGELLSRIRHPHVPRLQDRGWWRGRGGTSFPYIVMDWVEGVPLYEWASQRPFTSRQVLRLLAQVARALEATHAVEGVHRDVKGDNVLVRAEDDRAVLMDFGSGRYLGASTLTRQPPPPGTPQYQSPESLRFEFEHLRQPTVRYEARPADDLYALGMTAYRLVTGRYPPPTVEVEETAEGMRLIHLPLVPPESWVTLSPKLAALIRTMLSDEPSARGSAAEVAQELESAVKTAGREADRPIAPHSAQATTAHPARLVRLRHVVMGAAGLATVCVGLAVGAWWAGRQHGEEVAQKARGRDRQEAGTSGLGDTVLSVSASAEQCVPERSVISLDVPKQPYPGQRRPPCPKPEIEINDGCWIPYGDRIPPCGARSYEWKNRCYWPLFAPQQPATSDPK